MEHLLVWDYWGWSGSDMWDRLRMQAYPQTGTHVPLPASAPADRARGAKWPLFRTTLELNRIRQQSRVLLDTNAYAQGMMRNLENFVIGEGGHFKVGSKEKVDVSPDKPGQQLPTWLDEGISQAQDILDRWCEVNRWNGQQDFRSDEPVSDSREIELIRRIVRDGEGYIRIFELNGLIVVRWVEPEQVDDPPGVSNRDGWSFGSQNVMEPFPDVESIKQYHILWQDLSEAPTNSDTPTGEYVDAKDMIHVKVPGTDASVKRGLPFFSFDTFDAFDRAARLQRNTSLGASVRAATAEIWQHKFGTEAQISALAANQKQFDVTDPISGKVQGVERIYGGQIRRIPQGQELVQPPQDYSQGYLAAAQGDLRQAATAFCAPEHLASGDASNANYASTKESGTPFVRSGGKLQACVKSVSLRLAWKVLQHAADNSKIDRQVLAYLDIQYELPAISMRDELQKAQEDQILVGVLGVKSQQTAAMERGLDPEVELANRMEWQAKTGPQGPPLGLPGEEPPGVPGSAPEPKLPPIPGLESIRESLECDRSDCQAQGGVCPLTEGEGTCKPGERSDLTGCTPATGGAGSPRKHGERAAALHSKHQELKQARQEAFREIKADAQAARQKANEHFAAIQDAYGDIAWDSGDPSQEAFTHYETAVMDYDEDAPASERFNALKEIEATARDALDIKQKVLPATDDDAGLSQEDIDKNRKILSAAITHARQAREQLKAYVQHRKEIDAIKRGVSLGESRAVAIREAASYFAEAAGTCKAGERSDLTGCTPAAPDAASGQASSTDQPELHQQADAPGILKRLGAKVSALADRVPVVKQVKDGVSTLMKGVHGQLEKRYGSKVATAIMTSGGLGGYGVMATSLALTGIPGIPVVNDLVSILAHTAIAEVGYQLGLVGRGRSSEAVEQSLDQEALAKIAAEVRDELAAKINELVAQHKGGLAGLETDADVRDLVGAFNGHTEYRAQESVSRQLESFEKSQSELLLEAIRAIPAPVVPAPVVNYTPPAIHVPPAIVTVPEAVTTVSKEIERDQHGRISRVIKTQSDGTQLVEEITYDAEGNIAKTSERKGNR